MKRFIVWILTFAGLGAAAGAQSPSAKVLIIHDVTVIDATGAAAQPHRTVIVRDGKIEEIGSPMAQTLPGVHVNGSGKFLIPGLWDMHVHMVFGSWFPRGKEMKSGSKSDAIDARKLAELLRAGMLSAVYHGETSALEVQQMGRSYTQLTEDTTRVMARLKAVFRGQAVSCMGKKLYGKRPRDEYLAQLGGGLRRRAEHLYQELDALQPLRHAVRRELIAECRKHAAARWLQSVPFLGPIRAALLIGRVQTPHRFRTKRQFWTYCGLGLETRDSGQYRVVNGQVERRRKPVLIRGLNWNHNHEMKNLFKSTATAASVRQGVWREFYLGLLDKGMRPEMARLTLARKIAAITLKIWKKGEPFDAEHLKLQAA